MRAGNGEFTRGASVGSSQRSHLAFGARGPTFCPVASSLGEINANTADVGPPGAGAADRTAVVSTPEGKFRRITRFLKRLGPAGPLAVVATVLPPVGAVCLLGIVALYAPSLRDYRWAPIACAL